jgi:peptidoglycan/xylan/chitin deacetylase (PgdA/CDA1 family)
VQLVFLHHVWAREREAFERLLRRLALDHQFITYSEAVSRVASGSIDSPYIAFSIDDGLRSGMAAAQILEDFGARACFFVCPEIIGETDPALVEWFCRQRLGLPFSTDLLSWSELETLAGRGHEIGSHTMSHPCLSRLGPLQLEYEISQSYELLRQRLGAVKHFAWPFGGRSQFSAAAARVISNSGFVSCASGQRGCHTTGGQMPVYLRRDHIVASWPIGHSLYFLARNARK